MEKEPIKSAFELAIGAIEIEREYGSKIAPLELKIIKANVPPDIESFLNDFYQSTQETQEVKKEVVFMWKGNGSTEISSFHQIPHEPLSIRAHSQMKSVLKLFSDGQLTEGSAKFLIVYRATPKDTINEIVFGLVHVPGKDLEFFIASNKTNTIIVPGLIEPIKVAIKNFKNETGGASSHEENSKDNVRKHSIHKHSINERVSFTPIILNFGSQGGITLPPIFPSPPAGHGMVPGDFP